MKIKATIAAAAVTLVGIPLAPVEAVGFDNTHLPACSYEDGSGQQICVWNARLRGNGQGTSFIAVRGGTDRARYVTISHRLARRLG